MNLKLIIIIIISTIILYLLLINNNIEKFDILSEQSICINTTIDPNGGNVLVDKYGTYYINIGFNFQDPNIIIAFFLNAYSNGTTVNITYVSPGFNINIKPIPGNKGVNIKASYPINYHHFKVRIVRILLFEKKIISDNILKRQGR